MSKKFVAFGDSFINIFLSLSNKNFKIYKYKGAPIKGLVNKNDNYKHIKKILNFNKYDYGFFAFGQVDFFFYYYKKKYIDKKINILNIMYNYAEDYVKLISSFKNIKNKIILGILPSHIKNKNYKQFLINYGIFTEDNINLMSDDDFDYLIRNSRIIHFNNLLLKYCKKYGVKFCNIYNSLIDSNGNVNSIILLKHNELNVHFNYEILLFVYLKKCLSFLLEYYDLDKIYDIAENKFNEYMKPKKLDNSLNFDRINIQKFINKI
jgi:hypothetical protein